MITGLHCLDVPFARFQDLSVWLERVNATLPNHVMTGFTVSYVVVLLLFFPILYAVLRVVWALAAEGPARKSMTTFFILILGVPLYPLLAALLLALIWLLAGFVVLAISSFGPAALGLWALMQLWELMEKLVSEEQAQASRVQREDITCWELILYPPWELFLTFSSYKPQEDINNMPFLLRFLRGVEDLWPADWRPELLQLRRAGARLDDSEVASGDSLRGAALCV